MRALLLAFSFCVLSFSVSAEPPTITKEPVKIGDISSYTAGASYQTPYKKGWQMALDEINKAGGVLGRPLEFVSRDDMGNPEQALRIAENLVNEEHVELLTSSGFASVELALSNFSKRNKVLYIPAAYNSDRFIWQEGHDYAWRVGGPTPYVYNSMLAERAAKQAKIKWANVGPNYEWGHTNWDAFKTNLKRYQPTVEFVNEQWPKVNALNAGEVIQALIQSKPDAIYTSLFGNDLAQFIREGNKRGLFNGRLVVSVSAGMIQTMNLMKSETPQKWLVLAYPFTEIETPAMKRFVAAYKERYDEAPDFPSVYGYIWVYFARDLMISAQSTDTEILLTKLPNFTFESILGPLTMRTLDHQSTMGAWLGETAVLNGAPKVVNWEYKTPHGYFPTEEAIKEMKK